MNYKLIILFSTLIFFLGCVQSVDNQKKIDISLQNSYKNSGFALVYNNNLSKIKKIEPRSLDVYHKSLKKRSIIKIINPINGKYLIANVKSNKVKFPNFYNSVLSLRIAEELELDLAEPYVEILLLSKNSTFIAKKAKMFEEEKKVAEKAPVDGIKINNLNVQKPEKLVTKKKVFSYLIKVADFYYEKSAQMMIERIQKESSIKDLRIVRLSETKYRVLIGW